MSVKKTLKYVQIASLKMLFLGVQEEELNDIFCKACRVSFSSKRRPEQLERIIFEEYFSQRPKLDASKDLKKIVSRLTLTIEKNFTVKPVFLIKSIFRL